ncbi:hypothetical protein [Kineococcus sp. SYSU DK002]|uniref:hypothetical protein n=1 Tax=Kineococcus sp. SYSU DK002 TaxID=3383123 RepID=UPI003D7D31A8
MTVVEWDQTDDRTTGAARHRTAGAVRPGLGRHLRRHRGPAAAAALSVLWPGLGHAHLGRTAPAAGLIAAQVLLVLLTVAPGAWRFTVPAWGVLVALAAVTAWRAARERPGQRRRT